MAPSIVLIDTYYQAVIDSLGYAGKGELSGDYAENLVKLTDFGFGTGGAYVEGFRRAGWRADAIIPNALGLQSMWSTERNLMKPIGLGWSYGLHLARLPVVRNTLHHFPHIHNIVLNQIRELKPDVVMVQDLNLITPRLGQLLKRECSLFVGEIASPLPPKPYFINYDLILSALPTIVSTAKSWGLESEYVPLGFDAKWATKTPASSRPIDVIFVGSFSRHQPQTMPLLKEAMRQIPNLQIYGPASEAVLADAGLLNNYKGQAWGKDMFELLGRSKIVLNRHGTIAGDFAVNMRMFESTGAGAALVTEAKSNLSDLFDPGVEVATYENPQEAATLASQLLGDAAELDRLALAGQNRTLADHAYTARAQQLSAIFSARLRPRSDTQKKN